MVWIPNSIHSPAPNRARARIAVGSDLACVPSILRLVSLAKLSGFMISALPNHGEMVIMNAGNEHENIRTGLFRSIHAETVDVQLPTLLSSYQLFCSWPPIGQLKPCTDFLFRKRLFCSRTLSAIETKLCAPMQWPQSNAGIWALLGRRFVFGQYASQIQRQQLLKLSHNEDFAFGICFLIECHHASDYLERCVCSK